MTRALLFDQHTFRIGGAQRPGELHAALFVAHVGLGLLDVIALNPEAPENRFAGQEFMARGQRRTVFKLAQRKFLDLEFFGAGQAEAAQ